MATTTTLDSVLTGLAQDRATGSLRIGRAGTIFLTRGRVSYAECTGTPGVEELLTASGRISAGAVRKARQAATGESDPPSGGDRLVDAGVLTKGELEFCVLGATLDASYFLLGPALATSGARPGPKPRFKDGERHWLGTHWFFDVPGLFQECRRRKARLDRAWPSSELDTQPVIPVRRIPGRHVVLSALQWEVLLGADTTATPAELARRLGRPAYSTLLAVRELGAAGLLATGADPADQAAPPKPALPKRAERSGPRAELRPGPGSDPAQPYLPQVSADPTDVKLLIRLRDALEALQ
ncbi:MarR family transcriptional regulator [Microtetraspora malaysiensis]|uniref:MarR family transcriptional regulator n=1 Tax=Microtetraspora malaysiensis TaxID=161358 RepID=UPI000831C542|nr:helix-turn-helix domain-containing protein [Microtetraspora malaysiensis]